MIILDLNILCRLSVKDVSRFNRWYDNAISCGQQVKFFDSDNREQNISRHVQFSSDGTTFTFRESTFDVENLITDKKIMEEYRPAAIGKNDPRKRITWITNYNKGASVYHNCVYCSGVSEYPKVGDYIVTCDFLNELELLADCDYDRNKTILAVRANTTNLDYGHTFLILQELLANKNVFLSQMKKGFFEELFFSNLGEFKHIDNQKYGNEELLKKEFFGPQSQKILRSKNDDVLYMKRALFLLSILLFIPPIWVLCNSKKNTGDWRTFWYSSSISPRVDERTQVINDACKRLRKNNSVR